MRFIHTSDWQLGKKFRSFEDEVPSILAAERLEVIGRIGNLAMTNQSPIVLVAGDVFDGANPGLETLLRPI